MEESVHELERVLASQRRVRDQRRQRCARCRTSACTHTPPTPALQDLMEDVDSRLQELQRDRDAKSAAFEKERAMSPREVAKARVVERIRASRGVLRARADCVRMGLTPQVFLARLGAASGNRASAWSWLATLLPWIERHLRRSDTPSTQRTGSDR